MSNQPSRSARSASSTRLATPKRSNIRLR
jgi:hypothetical protein